MGLWSDLPLDLLELVEDCLILYADKLRIRAVCLSWYHQLPKLPNRQFPWLLQAVDTKNEATHALFNPIDKKFYFLDSPILLQGKIFKGSAFGWIVMLEDVYDRKNSNRIYIVNPLTRARIELPSRDKFPDVMRYQPYRVNKEYSIFSLDEGDNKHFMFYSFKEMNDCITDKFVMSCDPSSSDGQECVLVVIYGPNKSIACCTLKDTRWNPLPFIKLKDRECETCENIDTDKTDIDTDLTEDDWTLDVIFSKDPIILDETKKVHTIPLQYLVESSDGSCLMVVIRYIRVTVTIKQSVKVPETGYFKVYRVDPISRACVELKSIGDDILIIGDNTSISISSRNCIGYKRSHIYFTDHSFTFCRDYVKQEDNDIGVFNIEDGTLQPLCGFKSKPKFLWPPPIWV